MDNQPLVYIVLLNWKTPEMTAECILSLEDQTYDNFRIVVVDNASGDHSVSWLREKFKGVGILESPANKGFAGGCNIGIRYALDQGADAVWLLNNDTEPDSNALNELVTCYQSETGPGLIGSSVYKMNERDRPEILGGGYLRKMTARLAPRLSPDDQNPLCYVAGSSMLIRKEVFESIGLLDEAFFMYWEDIEFSHRASKAGFGLAHAVESVVYHEEHGTTEKNGIKTAEWFAKGTVLFYRKHVSFWIVPVLISYCGRSFKSLAKLNFNELKFNFSGFLDGVKAPLAKNNQQSSKP